MSTMTKISKRYMTKYDKRYQNMKKNYIYSIYNYNIFRKDIFLNISIKYKNRKNLY
jgi:hypothetical protein